MNVIDIPDSENMIKLIIIWIMVIVSYIPELQIFGSICAILASISVVIINYHKYKEITKNKNIKNKKK